MGKAGSFIKWKQYKKQSDDHTQDFTVRTGVVWCTAPKFQGVAGAHVWVIPDHKLPNENSAIAVRVYQSGTFQGVAVIYEDSPAYTEHSLKDVFT